MTDERCGNCWFWRARVEQMVPDDKPPERVCWRFPVYAFRAAYEWCGEWRAKPSETPVSG